MTTESRDIQSKNEERKEADGKLEESKKVKTS